MLLFIGVYIARQLIQAMNGEISFGSETATFCKVKLWFDKSDNRTNKYMQVGETPTDADDTTSQSDEGEPLFGT